MTAAEFPPFTAEDLEFLEQTQATVYFGAGKPVGIEFRRPCDGIRLGARGWSVREAIDDARAMIARSAPPPLAPWPL